MGVNNISSGYWYNTVPTYQFTMGANRCNTEVMFPCNGDTSRADTTVCGFANSAERALENSSDMFGYFMQLANKWKADQAELIQKVMASLQSGNVNAAGGASSASRTGSAAGSKSVDKDGMLKESQIIREYQKMSTGDSTKDLVNQKVGKDSTLVKSIISLLDEYRKNPAEAKLSESNYNLLWDIADSYHKTGELSSEDVKALQAIVKEPNSKKAEDEKKEGEISERPDKNLAERGKVGTEGGFDMISAGYKEALYDAWGTDPDKLYDATRKLNANNVLEIMNDFQNNYGVQKGQESLVNAIFDDCDGWGSGEGWLGMSTNDAKPHIDKLNKALVDRAKAFIKEHGEKSGITAADIPATCIDKVDRKKTAENFQNLQEKLTEAEKAVYGED